MTTAADLEEILVSEMKSLDDDLVDDDYENALNAAQWETWSLPLTDNFKVYWVKERAKRHLFFMLATNQAMEFKVKTYALEQPFAHLTKIYKDMDSAFERAKAEFPDAFPVLSDSDINGYELFGTYIAAGFQYNKVGKDTTYETSNSPTINPHPDDTD